LYSNKEAKSTNATLNNFQVDNTKPVFKKGDKTSLNKSKTSALPKTWDDLKYSENISPRICRRWNEIYNLIQETEDHATTLYWRHIKYMQLILLRDIYRQGWTPDWCDDETKYCILIYLGNIISTTRISINQPLSFQSEKIRDLFFDNFKDLIEECKEFI
ncbi:MAG: hypothetical protein IJ748_02130, partial [Bacteroidales bacterium]|nr:hypothetical protein [Bacteroidales bacterium]